MILKELQLTNFKNISEARLEMSAKLNCFVGNNGMGKSNILDAIYYLSFCKSFTGVTDAMLIKRGESFAMVKGNYFRRGVDEELSVGLGGRRKSFRRGGKDYKRLSAHIGTFPAVLVSPADMSLASGPSEERRRFLDIVISQGDARYLDALIKYGRSLEQRNRMLRDNVNDATLFEAVEQAMSATAAYIVESRRRHVDRLSEIHHRYYRAIAGDSSEDTALIYRTTLDDDSQGSLKNMLDRVRDRDRMLRFTTVGPHRDELEMTLDTMPLRRTASQGQIKTYTIALRLAQYELLASQTETSPLILLDDIFDKLDARRVENIINLVAGETFGQIFITDTNRKHLDEILARIATSSPSRLWTVADGCPTEAK